MKPNDLPLEVTNRTIFNLLRLKTALLEQPDKLFNMNFWINKGHECGTIYCLLGCYIAKYGNETGMRFTRRGYIENIYFDGTTINRDTYTIAAKAIGITEDESISLFANSPGYSPIDKAPSLAKLDKMIERYKIQELVQKEKRGDYE